MKDFKFDALLKSILKQNPGSWDFTPIADVIFQQLVLKVQNMLFRLSEFEFYLNDQQNQYDIFAHKHSGFTTGQIRLHGAGIDIAIEQNSFSGGILVRGLVELDENLHDTIHYIDGPWKIAQTLIGKMNINQPSFTIEWIQGNLPPLSYITAPRVGLRYRPNISPIKQLPYLYKPWRYISLPVTTKNDKFLIALEMLKRRFSKEKIREILALKASTIQSYKELMEEGKTISSTSLKDLANTIPDRCRSFGYYTMLEEKIR